MLKKQQPRTVAFALGRKFRDNISTRGTVLWYSNVPPNRLAKKMQSH